MFTLRAIGLYAMALGYFLAGLNHLFNPRFYRAMMPPWLPAPELMNLLAGLTEALLAVLLVIPATETLAAWGVIALLIAVFPANVYMYQTGGAGYHVAPWLLLARLPLQLVLIGWAYLYT